MQLIRNAGTDDPIQLPLHNSLRVVQHGSDHRGGGASWVLHRTIKQAREDSGLTLEAAAKRIGLSKAQMSRIESGSSAITAQRLAELAGVYGVSASALLDGAITRQPSEIDLDRLQKVVEEVQDVILEHKLRPSKTKVGRAVVEVYRAETEHLRANQDLDADPGRYSGLIEAIFRK